jgi:DNA-binding transcriptional LysR family regulator
MMDSRRTAAQKATCAPPVVTLGYHPMSTRLPPFAALRAFVAVGRAGGIRRAAEDLGLSHAIISRHLAALEQDVGEVLLNRRTGELTPSGATYYKRLSKAIQEMEGATEALRGGRHRELVIWCSAGLSLHWLARRLPAFAARHGLVVDLQSTDREPDFASGAVDGDIRVPIPIKARCPQGCERKCWRGLTSSPWLRPNCWARELWAWRTCSKCR